MDTSAKNFSAFFVSKLLKTSHWSLIIQLLQIVKQPIEKISKPKPPEL